MGTGFDSGVAFAEVAVLAEETAADLEVERELETGIVVSQ